MHKDTETVALYIRLPRALKERLRAAAKLVSYGRTIQDELIDLLERTYPSTSKQKAVRRG